MPDLIFRGEYFARTRNTVFVCMFTNLFGIPVVLLCVRYAVNPAGNWMENSIALMMATCGLIVAVVGALQLWKIIRNQHYHVEITKHGVTKGERFWRWCEISEFEGVLYGDRVLLRITLARDVEWFGEATLRTTPLLSVEQYVGVAY